MLWPPAIGNGDNCPQVFALTERNALIPWFAARARFDTNVSLLDNRTA
jgi:hypothetical protein